LKWKISLALILLGLFVLFLILPAKAKVNVEYEFIKYFVKTRNPNITDVEVSQIASSCIKWCEKRNLNLFSVLAIIFQESTFRPEVTGDHVSRGLMQLTKTALEQLKKIGYIKDYYWNYLFDIDYNLQLGTLYYLYCVKLAKGNRREAIARYRMTTDFLGKTAQEYADDVLNKRAIILREFENFKKK